MSAEKEMKDWFLVTILKMSSWLSVLISKAKQEQKEDDRNVNRLEEPEIQECERQKLQIPRFVCWYEGAEIYGPWSHHTLYIQHPGGTKVIAQGSYCVQHYEYES